MKVIRSYIVVLVVVLSMIAGAASVFAAKEDGVLKAAFVRNGDLWMKEGDLEKKLSSGPFIRNPKWSFDGEWIAYTKGEEEQELWLIQIQTGRSSLVSAEGGSNFQWAPNRNMLAFQTPQLLQYVDVKRPDKPLSSAKRIGNYSWLPDGKGFFASTQSELLSDGWTPVILYQIPLNALADPIKYVTLHVLPKPSDDFFAIGTSIFKWSADGRWIAFLATPTASLSADSNTLCVLRSDGVVFRTLDQMANNDQWFEWAADGARLAYIGGVGREASVNKQLKVLEVVSGKSALYTPKGYVDQSFTWRGPQHIVVSRAVEAERWGDPAKRKKPFLVDVELASGEQSRLTKPPGAFGAYNPVSVPPKLAWIRYNGSIANVIVANTNGCHAVEWIKSIDPAAHYYEQWDWNAVLQFYKRAGHSE
ncbi:TolB family protein [Paenibacillus prosopidis]|uniref:WD40 repeat protein n=1 Tax=Paenibacillus prosopidis TaxID=630520 RepID=A0A368VM67_9BACL|nr:PD40 domain-containing protein [Paenibacillus prosopidis]RCW41511.1 WD40 repeat protein [Paenibacillus prosopidis]